MFPGDAHGLEDTAILQAQAPVVSREHLHAGDTHVHQGRDIFTYLFIKMGQVHVKGVVNRGFPGFFQPKVHRIFKALGLLHNEITVVVPPKAAAL